MKKIVSLVLLVSMVVAMLSASVVMTNTISYAAEGFLANPGFETDSNSDNIPDGWVAQIWNGSSTLSWDSTVYYSGGHSVKVLNSTGATIAGWALYPDKESVAPLECYNYTVMVKTSSLSGKAYIQLVFYDSSDTYINESESEDIVITGTTNGWAQLNYQYVTPANATKVRVDLRVNGSGTVWFDDVDITQQAIYNKAGNASFELHQDSNSIPDEWTIGGDTLTDANIINPGFENVSGGLPANWSTSKWSGSDTAVTFAADSSVKHNGSYSAKVYSAAGNCLAGYSSAYLSVTEGSIYRISYYVKTDNAQIGPFLDLIFKDANSIVTIKEIKTQYTRGTNDWTKVYYECIAPKGSAKLRVDLREQGPGTAWFDDVSVIKAEYGTNSNYNSYCIWDTSEKRTSSHSVKITSDSNDDNARGWVGSKKPVIGGNLYNYSVYYKTSGIGTGENKGAYIGLVYYDSSGSVVREDKSGYITGTVSSWTKLTLDSTAPYDACTVRMDLRLRGTGTVWFDDLYFTQPSFNNMENPGVEIEEKTYGYTDRPDAWIHQRWSGTSQSAVTTWDNSISFTGGYSLKTSNATTGDLAGWSSNKVAVTAGKSYKYSAYVKTDSVSNKAILHLVYYDPNLSVLSETSSSPVSGTQNWAKLSYNNTSPANAAYVRVDFRLYDAGTAWFDNFDIEGPIVTQPSLLYSDSNTIAYRANNTEPYKSTYDSAKATADRYSSSDLDNIPSLYKWTSITFRDTSESNAVEVRLDVRARGQGIVNFDRVSVERTDNGVMQDFVNGGFETDSDLNGVPDNWSSYLWAGSSTRSMDSNNVMSGDYSVKINNTTTDALAGYVHDRIPIGGGTEYVYRSSVRIDSNIGDAFIDTIYYDSNNNLLAERCSADLTGPVVNTWYNQLRYMAADALVYLVSDSNTYAEKSKKSITFIVNDIYKGIKSNLRNTGDVSSGVYNIINVGRAFQTIPLVYDTIKRSGTFSDWEDKSIRYRMMWIINMLNNPEPIDKTFSYYLNSNPDRISTRGMTAIAMPGYSISRDIIQSAKDDFDWYLNNVVKTDGSISETPRYQNSVNSALSQLAIALKRYDATNMFSDTKFKAMYDFVVKIQTPQDAVNDAYPNSVLTPGIGDSRWDNLGMAPLAWTAPGFNNVDANFAKSLMWTWEKSNKPFKTDPSFNTELTGMVLIDDNITKIQPTLNSQKFDDIGYIVFRQDPGTDSHDYLIMRSSTYFGHNHTDQGSFSIHMNNTPISLDSTVYDYLRNGSYDDWYPKPKAHNNVIFKDPNTNVYKNGPDCSSISDFYTSSLIDYVKVNLPWNNVTRYNRHVFFVKFPYNFYVLWDDISGTTQTTDFMLHAYASGVSSNGNIVTAACYNNKDFELTFLKPSSISLTTGEGGFPYGTSVYKQKYITVAGSAGSDFLTVLYPKDANSSGLTTSQVTVTGSNAAAYKITKSDGSWATVLINRSTAQNVTLTGQTTDLVDMRTGTTYYKDGSGNVVVSMSDYSIMMFKSP